MDEQVTANTTYQRYNYQHSLFDSYEYDGTNDYIQGPENLMTTETTWTWSTWLNWGASGTGWYQVATNDHAADGTSSPQDNRVDFSIKDKKLQVNLGNSGGGTDLKLDSSYTLTSGDLILWTVVRTGSGGNYLQYVNGNLISTHTNATGYNFTTGKNTAWIGSGPSGAEKWNGDIAQMGYWDIALTASAIKDLYDKKIDGNWTTNGSNGDYTAVTTGELRAYFAMSNHDAIATGSYTRSASGGNSTGGSADSTSALEIDDKDGNNLLTVDSANYLVKLGIGQHTANTQYAHFGIGSGDSVWAGASSGNHYAVPFNSIATQALVGGGTSTDPATSFTVASTADDMVGCLWYVMDDITIDRVIWWTGADAATSETFRAHLMYYTIDQGNTSTSGDLSSGAVSA